MNAPFVVELPAQMRPLLEAEARAHGFARVADYFATIAADDSRAHRRSVETCAI